MIEIEDLDVDLQELKDLSKLGGIEIKNGYHYVTVDEKYIEYAGVFLKGFNIRKPNYPAHVSLIYPDEKIKNTTPYLARDIEFVIEKLVKIEGFDKIYYALLVSSKELQAHREYFGLSSNPKFKGIEVPFHITVAKESD